MSAISRRVLEVPADVSARAESTARPGYDDDSNLVVNARVRKRFDNLVNHYLRISIELFGPVQRDRGDVLGLFIYDLAIFHCASSASIPASVVVLKNWNLGVQRYIRRSQASMISGPGILVRAFQEMREPLPCGPEFGRTSSESQAPDPASFGNPYSARRLCWPSCIDSLPEDHWRCGRRGL